MISKVVLRRFKRFAEATFDVGGHVVLAGPNNSGKTTLLQAIAAWALALGRWRGLNDFNRRRGGFAKAPVARRDFSAVPLRAFGHLWNDLKYRGAIEIEVTGERGWAIPMEFLPNTTEQVFVRPCPKVADLKTIKAHLKDPSILPVVFIPPMTGLGTEEPVYTRPKIDQLLGQARTGEVLRNLLVEAHATEDAWQRLQDSVGRLFRYEMAPPDPRGANIVAEYRTRPGGPLLDVASAGSGFQQVLMLLAFLHTRRGAVLLLDEPDAHLHVILQDAIYNELRGVAQCYGSQLVIATHSEVIVNAVEPRMICALLDKPVRLACQDDRNRLILSLKVLTNEDVLLAMNARGVLYLEDRTDFEILRAWAKTLRHPAYELLTTRLMWKKTVIQARDDAKGMQSRDHFAALRLVHDGFRGVELVDGDGHPDLATSDVGDGPMTRLRWRRYEIESYLLHPAALERFVRLMVGEGAAALAIEEMRVALRREFREAVDALGAPEDRHPLLEALLQMKKARTSLLPPILEAAGIVGFDYTRYFEIAEGMLPEEIHPEVIEKLDAIVKAFPP
ncbi:MAG: AAA family ATPase [Deltaproteobacteria bacterium]|nr:AAA family ATPase [Deltaproteobacteria bacterium]